jgi:hypothetical protein
LYIEEEPLKRCKQYNPRKRKEGSKGRSVTGETLQSHREEEEVVMKRKAKKRRRTS